jgi:DNA-binding NtrC family response regulator
MSVVVLAGGPRYASSSRVAAVEAGEVAALSEGARHASLLIVEDDSSVRILLGRALAGDGVTIAEAGNAEEAQRIARARRPDVVIADVVMPGRSGIDLRRDLTQSHPGLPVILISGYSPEQVAEFAARTPATSFLPKPFTISELRRMVNDALSGHLPRESAPPSPDNDDR